MPLEGPEQVGGGGFRVAAFLGEAAPEAGEGGERLVRRIRHEVADDVANRCEVVGGGEPHGHALVVGPPPGAEPDPGDRVLLRQVVEEVPAQVGGVVAADRSRRHREEPNRGGVHEASASSCSR